MLGSFLSEWRDQDFSAFLHLRNGAASTLLTGLVWCILQVVPEEFLAEGWLAQIRTGRDHASN